MFLEELNEKVVQEMEQCIGCNECMRVCPVSKPQSLTIKDMNAAITDGKEPKGDIREFALNCVQCGRCVPVCPPGVRRDLMVLYTKYRISSYPNKYDSYVRLKQPDPPGPARALYAIKKRTMKNALGDLYEKCDISDLNQAEILFYPGCYIFNEVCHKTVAILRYLKADFEILAGYSTCCGWPQYLQGRLEMADEFMDILWKNIQKVSPKYIITTCAECYAALRKLKAWKQAEFVPLTTTEYFLLHQKELPLVQITEKKIGFHDSCHISRKYNLDQAPRELLEKLGNFSELENHHDQTMCCYYYNFEYDKKNDEHRKERIQEVKDVGKIMVTDCITCYEVFKEKMKAQKIDVFDFNEMVYHCIQLEKQGKTRQKISLTSHKEDAK
jgi:Fe-S oxidoreductase